MNNKTGSFEKGVIPFYKGLFFSIIIALFSIDCFAESLSITPQRELPTTVPQYGKTSAYYTITNTTALVLNNNFLKNLPPNVTQVTCEPNYCGATFNLGASGSGSESCILKLTIKGVTNANITVCTENESNCNETASPLNVSLGPTVPFIGIASGTYLTETSFFPLLAITNDSGSTWDYPKSIFENLQQSIDPQFTGGFLRTAACSGSLDKSVCIAPGSFCNDSDCFTQLPLIAVGRDNGSSWVYPNSVFADLQTKIDPTFQRGYLTGANCTGSGNNAFCIASGVFLTNTIQSPLLALSANGGSTWSYPTTIFQNLQTSIDPNFTGGFLSSASCNQSTCDSVCITTGGFSTSATQLPLIALSRDKGQTWIYPHSIYQNLDTLIDPNFQNGEFVSSSCTGKGNKTICIAAGLYYNNITTQPLLALTKDGGNTWEYPSTIFTNLPAQINPKIEGAEFNAASCTGTENSARCIAAGFGIINAINTPLLALTKDGGQNWSYPAFIHSKLKKLVDFKFRTGKFNGASCIDKGKDSICLAAGDFCTDKFCNIMYPLIATTNNGGKTWSYPTSVFKNLKDRIDPNLIRATFSDVSCSGQKEHSFCIASGEYSTDFETFPLTAYSIDNGNTWSYPPYIFQDLLTTIAPDFKLGFFSKAGSTGGQLNPKKKSTQISGTSR